MVRSVLVLAAGVWLAGCSCNQDYQFSDEIDLIQSTDEAPLDHGAWLSMGVAPDGERLVVSYYDREVGALGFAVGEVSADGSTVSWKHEKVDGYAGSDGLDPGDRGKYSSMKVAPDGTVWVAYQNVSRGGLLVAHRTGKTWETFEVDNGVGSSPSAGKWCSLDLDADGNPVIAHQDTFSGALRISRYQDNDGEASWTSEDAFIGLPFSGQDAEGNPVLRLAGAGAYARLEIVDGVEYVAFYDSAQQTLNLIEGTSGNYAHTVIDDIGNVGAWPSLLIQGDSVMVAYHDVGNQDLRVATREGDGAFISDAIDNGDFIGADTEIFDKDGEPSIVYFDGQNNDMWLATFNGSGWTRDKLGGDDAAVGFHNEVARTADGRFFAASYDYTNRAIFVKAVE